MKVDWVEEQGGFRALAWPWPLWGITKEPAGRGDHGPANRRLPPEKDTPRLSRALKPENRLSSEQLKRLWDSCAHKIDNCHGKVINSRLKRLYQYFLFNGSFVRRPL